MWLQRKIEQRVKGGVEHLRLSAQTGWNHLNEDIAQMGADNKFTRLVWPLEEGADPDDAFSGIPYEKGFNLLFMLESIVGSTAFEAFAKAYIGKFKYGTVTSGEFKDCFLDFFRSVTDATVKKTIRELDWDQLFLGTGMPLSTPDFSNSLSVASTELGRRWVDVAKAMEKGGPAPKWAAAKDIEGWSTQQKILFLECLLNYLAEEGSTPYSDAYLRALDGAYSLTTCPNAEIKFRWQSICIRCEAAWIVPHVASFVSAQGRMKYVRPLYRALMRSRVGKSAAVDTFIRHSGMYHSICRKMLITDFKVAGINLESDSRGGSWSGLAVPLLVTGALAAVGMVMSRRG